jgi:ATP-dependent Clp protease protease subunit
MKHIMKDPLPTSQTVLNALALGLDLEHRTIYVNGGIEANLAYRFISGFKWLDRSSGPIHVIINSPGGSVDDGLAMYDCMRTANNPIICEGMGVIASAAVPLLLAGTVRFLNPETRVMVHNMSYEIDGTIGTPIMLSLGKETERGNKRYHEIIAERTRHSIKDIEKWCQEETFFSSQEAIKYGFADKILDVRPMPKDFDEGMREVRELIGDGFVLDTNSTEAKKTRKKRKPKAKAKKGKK